MKEGKSGSIPRTRFYLPTTLVYSSHPQVMLSRGLGSFAEYVIKMWQHQRKSKNVLAKNLLKLDMNTISMDLKLTKMGKRYFETEEQKQIHYFFSSVSFLSAYQRKFIKSSIQLLCAVYTILNFNLKIQLIIFVEIQLQPIHSQRNWRKFRLHHLLLNTRQNLVK